MNGIDLRAASHDEAINVLRQTPQRVRLAVYRDEAQYKEEDLWDSFTVELHKNPGQGLGLSIVGRRWDDGRISSAAESVRRRAFTYNNSRVVTPLGAFWVTVGVSVLKNT